MRKSIFIILLIAGLGALSILYFMDIKSISAIFKPSLDDANHAIEKGDASEVIKESTPVAANDNPEMVQMQNEEMINIDQEGPEDNSEEIFINAHAIEEVVLDEQSESNWFEIMDKDIERKVFKRIILKSPDNDPIKLINIVINNNYMCVEGDEHLAIIDITNIMEPIVVFVKSKDAKVGRSNLLGEFANLFQTTRDTTETILKKGAYTYKLHPREGLEVFYSKTEGKPKRIWPAYPFQYPGDDRHAMENSYDAGTRWYRDMRMVNHYLLVTSEGIGLYDISNPEKPTYLTELIIHVPVFGAAEIRSGKIVLEGDYAYFVVDGSALNKRIDMAIVDISKLNNSNIRSNNTRENSNYLREVNSINIYDYPNDYVIKNKIIAYVDGSDSVWFVNTANGDKVVSLAQIDMAREYPESSDLSSVLAEKPSIYEIAGFYSNYFYLIGKTQVEVVDINDLEKPRCVAVIKIASENKILYTSQTGALLFTQNGVLDVSNPMNPNQVHMSQIQPEIKNDKYDKAYYDWVQWIDERYNKYEKQLAAYMKIINRDVNSSAYYNKYLYVSYKMGFEYDVIYSHLIPGLTENPPELSNINVPGRIVDMRIRGNHLFVLTEPVGLFIYKLTEHNEVTLIGNYLP